MFGKISFNGILMNTCSEFFKSGKITYRKYENAVTDQAEILRTPYVWFQQNFDRKFAAGRFFCHV